MVQVLKDAMAKLIRIAKDAEVLTAGAQTTTNSYADLSGSKIDTTNATSVSFVVKNTGGSNGAYWKIVGSNDDSSYVDVNSEATLAAGVSASYATAQAVYRYYKVQIKAQVGGSQTTVSAVALAKV